MGRISLAPDFPYGEAKLLFRRYADFMVLFGSIQAAVAQRHGRAERSQQDGL
jgi:hypothetical protein